MVYAAMDGAGCDLTHGLTILQLEFYFSDANLRKDRFMKQQIDSNPGGCV
jgi:hypothetical protein